jgi:sirohydrochlorin cobaltochelatase
MFRERFGSKTFMGVVEGYPSRKKIVTDVEKSGFRKVRLVPFMLVAGTHFKEDLAGGEDSWKTAFEEKGILVSIETKGLGYNQGIVDIFCKHIQDALDVIP